MTQSINSLIVDIGGTNTRIATAHGDQLNRDSIQRFKNANYPDLETVLADYLDGAPPPPAICVDIAGPVKNGIGTLTNLNWTISAPALKAQFGFQVADVLNDMQAQVFGLNAVPQDNLINIYQAPKIAGGTQLVVNLGTGFNSGPVYHLPTGPFSPPAETGHVDLIAPTAELQALYAKLQTRLGFVSVEECLSGRGIANIHAIVAGLDTPISSHDIFAATDTADVQTTLDLASGLLARVTANLALSYLPTGGIYMVGGIAVALAGHLKSHGFEAAYLDKGRFSDFLKQFNIAVVNDDDTALLGCAAHINRIAA